MGRKKQPDDWFFEIGIALIVGITSIVFKLLFALVSNILNNQQSRKQEKEQLELQKQDQLKEKISNLNFSDSRFDYIIQSNDYKRGNKIENAYRKQYFLPLLDLYKNKCAKCHNNTNGIELDHFILSKNEGGNFILRHKEGYLVNNAIPLCKPCNSSKSDNSYKEFFTSEELIGLLTYNNQMTKLLNSEDNISEN